MNKTSMQILRARSARIVKAAVVAAAISIAAPAAYGPVTAQQPEGGPVSKKMLAVSFNGLTLCGFKCWWIAPTCCIVVINRH